MFVLLGMTVVVILSIGMPLFINNIYQSRVHAVFDPTDVSMSGYGGASGMSYDMMERLFRARFLSQEFLYEVSQTDAGKEILGKKSFGLGSILNSLRGLLSSRSDETGLTQNGKRQLSPDMVKRAEKIARLISLDTNQGPGVLGITTRATSPELAAAFADQTIELFIQTELQDQIARIRKRIAFLRESINSENPQAVNEEAAEDPDLSKVREGSELRRMEIVEKERELNEQLGRLNRELLNNQSERSAITRNYEAETAKLLNELQPNHPIVQAKKSDYLAKTAVLKDQEEKLKNQVEQLRRQLWRTRTMKVNAQGAASLAVDDSDGYQGAFFLGITDRINDLELELRNLTTQVENPEKRTRLRILFPATIENKAFKSQRRKGALASFALGTMFVFAFVGFREIRNPIARDDWRIERATKRPVLAQVASTSLSHFRRISPDDADQLRESLSAHNPKNLKVRTMLSYRRLELALDKHCQGNIIMLSSAGPSDQLGETIYSFLNIYCTDTGKNCLLLDFDHQDPVVSNYKAPELDYLDVLQEKADWKDVIVKQGGENQYTAFDFVHPTANFSGNRNRLVSQGLLQAQLPKLVALYDRVFLRSFPEFNFIENASLITAASDCIVCVDARKTRFLDLERTQIHLDSEKIRGMMLIGT